MQVIEAVTGHRDWDENGEAYAQHWENKVDNDVDDDRIFINTHKLCVIFVGGSSN